MGNIGRMYYAGQGVSTDKAKAAKWFLVAAEKGHIPSMYNLAVCYEDGDGVNQDLDKAIFWYEQAAEQHSSSSLLNLGFIYASGHIPDYPKAFGYWKQSAELGSEVAMFNLGRAYELGLGIDKNITTAKDWYRKAADQGDSQATTALKRFETK